LGQHDLFYSLFPTNYDAELAKMLQGNNAYLSEKLLLFGVFCQRAIVVEKRREK